jgi:hypothetical protein
MWPTITQNHENYQIQERKIQSVICCVLPSWHLRSHVVDGIVQHAFRQHSACVAVAVAVNALPS